MYRRQIIGVLNMVCIRLWSMSTYFYGRRILYGLGCFIFVVIFKYFWEWSRRHYYNVFNYRIHLLRFKRLLVLIINLTVIEIVINTMFTYPWKIDQKAHGWQFTAEVNYPFSCQFSQTEAHTHQCVVRFEVGCPFPRCLCSELQTAFQPHNLSSFVCV